MNPSQCLIFLLSHIKEYLPWHVMVIGLATLKAFLHIFKKHLNGTKCKSNYSPAYPSMDWISHYCLSFFNIFTRDMHSHIIPCEHTYELEHSERETSDWLEKWEGNVQHFNTRLRHQNKHTLIHNAYFTWERRLTSNFPCSKRILMPLT